MASRTLASMTTAKFDLSRIGGKEAVTLLETEIRAAGKEALRLYADGAANRVVRKQDKSPVTEADKAVEEHLRKVFDKHFPQVGFLGEETGEKASAGGLRFIVDPIDGTRAFLRGIPTWSTLVGLEADGEPVLGFGHFPADGDMLVGALGHGVTYNGAPVRLSEVDSLDNAVISHGGLHQFTEHGMDEVLLALGRGTFTQRGFTDFDGYRKLVLGQVDAMIDPGIKSWDVCPAAVFVREVGGRLTSFDGVDTIHAGHAVASNGHIHDALLSLIQNAMAKGRLEGKKS